MELTEVLGHFPWALAVDNDREKVRGCYALALLDGMAIDFTATYVVGGRRFRYKTWLWPTDLASVPLAAIGRRVPDEIASLAPREREIMKLYAKGLTSRQIARRIKCSASTVQTHRRRIAKRLGFSGRSVEAIIAFATEHFASDH